MVTVEGTGCVHLVLCSTIACKIHLFILVFINNTETDVTSSPTRSTVRHGIKLFWKSFLWYCFGAFGIKNFTFLWFSLNEGPPTKVKKIYKGLKLIVNENASVFYSKDVGFFNINLLELENMCRRTTRVVCSMLVVYMFHRRPNIIAWEQTPVLACNMQVTCSVLVNITRLGGKIILYNIYWHFLKWHDTLGRFPIYLACVHLTHLNAISIAVKCKLNSKHVKVIRQGSLISAWINVIMQVICKTNLEKNIFRYILPLDMFS